MFNSDLENKASESGFSLIEVAIFMVILGLLIGPFLQIYELEQKAKRVNVTESNLRIIDSALSKYAIRTGRYPRPAHRNIGPEDANFGQEVALGGNPACAGGDAVVCQTAGVRDTAADADAAADPVLIGDIPFAALGVPYKFILDGYGRKMTYAVSLNMTNPALAPVEDNWGAIEILDQTGGDHRSTNRDTHFVLISHGENGEGTYSHDGGLLSACNVSGAQDDNINCDGDGSFLSNFNDITSGVDAAGVPVVSYARIQNLQTGNTYYDDFIQFRTTVTGDIWTQQIGVVDILNTNTGNIRIGSYPNTALGSPDAKVTVMDGNVTADTVYFNRLCDMISWDVDRQCNGTPTNASLILPAIQPRIFSPAAIGGTVIPGNEGEDGGGIKCPEVGATGAHQAMRGIYRVDEECGLTRLPTGYVYNPGCPSGQYPRRIVGGVIECEIP